MHQATKGILTAAMWRYRERIESNRDIAVDLLRQGGADEESVESLRQSFDNYLIDISNAEKDLREMFIATVKRLQETNESRPT